jgi:DNA polymerase I-like protein with 3'-5' exonuclease and polymerase domains
MQWAARENLFAWDGDPGIPASELGRDLIEAAPGNIFVNADKSQIEPRITAIKAKDKLMQRILREGRDQHSETARLIYQLDDDEQVTPEQRADGKQVNLGMQYGMGYKKLAEDVKRKTNGRVDWTVKNYKRAKEVYKLFYEGYAGLAGAMEKEEERCTRRLYERGTLAAFKGRKPFYIGINHFGRIRRFCITPQQEKLPDFLLDADYKPHDEEGFYYNEFMQRANKCARQAWNFQIQSAAACLLKYAELFVTRALDKEFKDHPKWDRRQHGIKIFLHDELLVEVPEELGERAREIVVEQMMRASYLLLDPKIVPAKVNSAIGKTWHECGQKLKK